MPRPCLRALAAALLLLSLTACGPRLKPHRDVPSGTGPSAVGEHDPQPVRDANPADQKKQP